MSKTKVAFVEARYHSFYGAQRSMYTLVTNLPRDRIEAVVVVPNEGIVAEQFRKANVAVAVVPLHGKANTFGGEVLRSSILQKAAVAFEVMRYNARVARLFKRERVHVAYVNDLRALLYVGFACKLIRLPLIWYVRSDGQPSILSRLGLRLADKVVLIAEGVRGVFGDTAYERNRKKFVTLYTGFHVREISRDDSVRSHIRHKLAIPKDAQVVGIVGSVTTRKGHDLLVEALPRLREMNGDVRLLIVGDVSPGHEGYFEQLRGRVNELELSPYVYWAGYHEDVSPFYSAMDIFALPSRSEGLPRTLIEALSFGLPVVATDVGGVREILTSDIHGRVVTPEDPDALLAAITDILTSPEMKTEEAAAARVAYVKTKFSIEAYVDGFLSIVEDLTSTALHGDKF